MIVTMKQYTPYIAAQDRYERSKTFYRRCGRSGIVLPCISLGLWKGFGEARLLKDSREILHYAFDHGVTHFDLANNYGPPYGAAEETFGRVMKLSFRPYRDELFISTKAGYDMWPGLYGNWGSRKYLTASLDQSLQRMKLDYVDLFYSHRFDPLTPIEETLQAMVDIVRAGKALYLGISRWPLKETRRAVEYLRKRDVPVLTYQGRFNLLDREVEENGILDFVNEENIGFVSFSPLAQGLLTDRYLHGIPADSRMRTGGTLSEDRLTPELLQVLHRFNDEASQNGDTLSGYALKSILKHPAVTSVIVGVSRLEQLKANLAACDQ